MAANNKQHRGDERPMEITFTDIAPYKEPGNIGNRKRMEAFVAAIWDENGEATLTHIRNAINMTKSEQYSMANSLTYYRITIDGDEFVLAEDNAADRRSTVVFSLVPAADSPIDTILTNHYIDSRLPANAGMFK